MFQAPSAWPKPMMRVLELQAREAGTPLLPSGVYASGSFQVVVERQVPQGPLSPPALANHRVIPLSGGVFSEVGRRLGPLLTVSCLGALLAGRVYGAKAWEDQRPFLIDPAPGESIAKLHVPGVEVVQEIPELELWQWLELMSRVQLTPFEGKAVYQAPTPLQRLVGAKVDRGSLASEWVGVLRGQHVELLAKTGDRRLQWLDPQPSAL